MMRLSRHSAAPAPLYIYRKTHNIYRKTQLYTYRKTQLYRKTRFLLAALLAFGILALGSCVDEEYPSDNTPRGNFEALWQLMDEHYCFFGYKQEELGVDWDEVHTRYAQKISSAMSNIQLFEVLAQMLAELRDGHVNLSAPFDLGRNWSFYEAYPDNFDTELCEAYLGKGNDYQIASSLRYRILDDNVAYVRCASFADGMGEGNLSAMFSQLAGCNGLILDLRDNSGGQLTYADRLASHFTNGRVLTGYVRHKTGKGHADFSSPQALHIDPAEGVRWQKPAVLLTNRSVYSAANHFASAMRQMPLVTLMGDTTGGGSGMPFSQETPNGWTVRYSAVVFTDAADRHIEFGVAPDTLVSLDSADVSRGHDTLIEAARQLFAR